MKSLSYLPASPSFIVFIRYLISPQSSAYYQNTSKFLFVEAKTRYLFSLLSSMSPSALPIIKYEGFAL